MSGLDTRRGLQIMAYKGYKYKTKRKTYLRKYMRKYREINGEPSKVGYRHRLRARVVELLGGAKCVNCGCDEDAILEINHINGGGNQELKARDLTMMFRDILMGRRDVSEFNVLCRPCNTLHYIQDIIGIQGFKITWKSPVSSKSRTGTS